MPTYLVRLIANHDLVGVFVARDIEELAIIIDEGADPGACEYQRIRPSGIMWTGRAIPVPIETPEDADGTEEDPIPWGGASLSESWSDYFYGYVGGRWKPLFPDWDEPHGTSEPGPQRPGHAVPFRKLRGK